MKKLLFALFTLLTAATFSLNAQQARTVKLPTAAEHFQLRLESLYKAIDAKDQPAVVRHEREISRAMRQAIDAAGTPENGTDDAKYKTEMETVLNKFEGFTFVNAAKDAIDEHLALLEEFLGMMTR